MSKKSDSSDEYQRYGFPAGRDEFDGRSRSRGFEASRGDEYGRGGRGHFKEPVGRGGGFQSKAIVSSQAQGSHCNLISNHFKFGIRTPGYIYMYNVDFGAGIKFQAERGEAMRNLKDDMTKVFGMHIGYGNNLFALQLVNEPVEFQVEVKGMPCLISFSYEARFTLDEQDPEKKQQMDKILHFVLSVVKKTLLEQDYRQVGRLPRFFNAKEKKEIPQESLYIWPGYDCSVKCFNDGIFLNVDTTTKFINKETIYDKILNLRKQRYSLNEIKEQLIPSEGSFSRLVVITMYNTRIYQINDITFDLTPKTYVFTWIHDNPQTKKKETMKTNMVDYFMIRYQIPLQGLEESQPLLVVNERDVTIFLPASLCHEANLPKNFTKDSRRMRELHQYKIQDPLERWERIGSIIEKIEQERTFEDWNIKLHPNFSQVKARILYQPKIMDKGELRDFKAFENNSMQLFNPILLENEKWAIVYSKGNSDNANLLLEMIQKAQGALGISMVDPQWIEIPYIENSQDYMVAIDVDIDPKYTIMVIVLLDRRDHKPPVKKLLDQMGIPSQFICNETIYKKKFGIYTNLLRQINAKLRHDLYKLQLSRLTKTMVVGFDLVNHEGSKRIIGMCSSYSPSQTQYFSKVAIQETPKSEVRMSRDEQEDRITQKRTQILIEYLQEALQNYQEQNKGNLPEQIIVYRDGIGGPTLMEKCLHYEVKAITSFFETYTSSYLPKIIYSFVDKLTSHRLFSKNNGACYNPGPGTVVDTSLVEQQGEKFFDFFLIPHKATVATARPVHFKIVYNTSDMNKDQIETSTYHLCYNYYGFGGPIRVPSCCMYAKKIATYAHDNSVQPNAALSLNLHFL